MLDQYNFNDNVYNLVHVSQQVNEEILKQCTKNNVNYFHSNGTNIQLINKRDKLNSNILKQVHFATKKNHLDYSHKLQEKLINPDCDRIDFLIVNDNLTVSETIRERVITQINWTDMNLNIETVPDKPIIIMGNGPSLKSLVEFGLHRLHENFDTFGLNSAYRYYEKEDFYPTYFGSFDSRVTPHNCENIYKYMENGEFKTKRFFTIKNWCKAVADKPHVDARKDHRSFNPHWYCVNTGYACSGHTATKWALQRGYKKIYIIGVDANYKDYVDGSAKESGGLVMKKTPKKNPNYFFDDYQRKGDKYNVPGAAGHIMSWKEIKVNLQHNEQLGIEIINLSEISKLDMFPKKNLRVEFENYFVENV